MTKDISHRLEPHRTKIDHIDAAIIDLLAQRQAEVAEIGSIKLDSETEVYDPKRELSARTKRRRHSVKRGLDPLQVEMVFEQIVVMAKKTQDRSSRNFSTVASELSDQLLRVGVMGGLGSFSEAAALEFLRRQGRTDYELYYPISSENVLTALDKGEIDLGIFPIENTTAGLVKESIYAASRHRFEILDIFELEVVQCLMALPGVKKHQLTRIMSHPQALGQCKGYLQREFPDAALVEATDTAEGARVLSESEDERTLGVIAPKRCAELYGISLLEEGIQDLEVNLTRFIAAIRPNDSFLSSPSLAR